MDYIQQAQNNTGKDNYKILLDYDQLKDAQKNKKAFDLFEEAPIMFAPSYKFLIKKNIYNE